MNQPGLHRVMRFEFKKYSYQFWLAKRLSIHTIVEIDEGL